MSGPAQQAAPLPVDVADRLLTTTRATRRRLDLSTPVPRELIVDALSVAMHAPSAANEQRWRWLIVEDADLRREIAWFYRRSFESYMETKLIDGDDRENEQQRRVATSAHYLAEHLSEVPVHVVACAAGRLPQSPDNADTSSFYGSVYPAIWSFQLALRSRRLASVLTTLHLAYEQEVGQLLGIPSTVTQIALLPVAYRMGAEPVPAPRPSASRRIYVDAWQRKACDEPAA